MRVALLILAASTLFAEGPSLTNGDLRTWVGDVPDGWTVGVGAGRGEPASIVEPVEGGGLVLRGDASRRTWRIVSQPFAAQEGDCVRLAFEAKVRDMKHEEGQFESGYVGIAYLDAEGKAIGVEVEDVVSSDWASDTCVARAPKGTGRGEVRIFLAQTGALSVRSLAITRVAKEEAFDLLVAEMDRHYSHFDTSGVDWKALTDRYREKAKADFVPAVREMLTEMMDLHISIRTASGETLPTFVDARPANYDFKAVAKRLQAPLQIGEIALYGRTTKGYGYFAIRTLRWGDSTWPDGTAVEISTALDGLIHAPGMIVDLRANEGGDERKALWMASWFTSERRTYARTRVRGGTGHGDFAEVLPRVLDPRKEGTYACPVVCLIGPRCVSSGEGFAAMMKSIPGVVLVGQPTCGASGNPRPLGLPNDVVVWYPRWQSLLPDGTPTEGKGIAPDVIVEQRGEGDPTFEAALKELSRDR